MEKKSIWEREIVICWLGMHEAVSDGWEGYGESGYTTSFFRKCKRCGARWKYATH